MLVQSVVRAKLCGRGSQLLVICRVPVCFAKLNRGSSCHGGGEWGDVEDHVLDAN